MSPAVLKCLLGVGTVGGAAGGVVYWKGGFRWLLWTKRKLMELGVPERCIKDGGINQCSLTAEDLSKIKFHGFQKEGKSEVTPLWVGDGKKNWEHNQSIKLSFRDGKCIFENYFEGRPRDNQLAHRAITITRGSASVTLDGNMDSEFTVEDDGLKKQEVNVLGFPKRCEIGDKEEKKSCILSDNDIRRLNLKKTEISPDLLYTPKERNKKMKLTIEKTDDASYPYKKKYFLEFMGDFSLTIRKTVDLKDDVEVPETSDNTLIFFKNSEKLFKRESNQLIVVN